MPSTLFNLADAASIAVPLRPGERLLNGRPYVYDQDALNRYEADLAFETAPADLTRLSDDELTERFYGWLNRHARFPHDPDTAAYGKRICDERTRREATTRRVSEPEASRVIDLQHAIDARKAVRS